MKLRVEYVTHDTRLPKWVRVVAGRLIKGCSDARRDEFSSRVQAILDRTEDSRLTSKCSAAIRFKTIDAALSELLYLRRHDIDDAVSVLRSYLQSIIAGTDKDLQEEVLRVVQAKARAIGSDNYWTPEYQISWALEAALAVLCFNKPLRMKAVVCDIAFSHYCEAKATGFFPRPPMERPATDYKDWSAAAHAVYDAIGDVFLTETEAAFDAREDVCLEDLRRRVRDWSASIDRAQRRAARDPALAEAAHNQILYEQEDLEEAVKRLAATTKRVAARRKQRARYAESSIQP